MLLKVHTSCTGRYDKPEILQVYNTDASSQSILKNIRYGRLGKYR